jgi:cyanate lyase
LRAWRADAKNSDGILSVIDFDMAIERVADPKGDRIKITVGANSCRSNTTAIGNVPGGWV